MTFIRTLHQRLKRMQYRALGLGPEIDIPVEEVQADPQPWTIAAGSLKEGDIVYSCGLADNITFDLRLIERLGVVVHGFDPTPESQAYLSNRDLPQQMHAHPVAVASHENGLEFHRAPGKCAGAFAGGGSHGESYRVPSKSLRTIMEELGHRSIALLKLDIEGSEYEVIDDLLRNDLDVSQIVVEFHHRFKGIGIRKTLDAVAALRRKGYRLFHVSPWCEEFAFLRQRK